jgi:hypothetical protein
MTMGTSTKSKGSIKENPGTAASGATAKGAVTSAKGAYNGKAGRGGGGKK